MANLLQSGVASAERVFELLDADEEVAESRRGRRRRPTRGARSRFERRLVPLRPGQAADRGPVAGRAARARPSPSSARPAPARPRWSTWSCGSTSSTRGRITLDGVDITDDAAAPTCAAGSAWCCRTPGCSRARSATTSPTAGPTPPRTRCSRRRGRRSWTGSCTRCPTATTPWSTRTARNLSAGERQLITIARAFLADPALLILDEATSSVDTRTELLLQHAMAALRTDRTSFVIAHRLSTIRDADLILVMEDGRDRRAGHPRRSCSPRTARTPRLYQAQFAARSPEECSRTTRRGSR